MRHDSFICYFFFLSLFQTTSAATLDDYELDFFDDANFVREFDNELVPLSPSAQNQAVEGELDESTAHESEFDDDLDAVMSQM